MALISFIFAFFILKARMNFLVRHPGQYNHSYDGHGIFLDILFRKIRYISRVVFIYIKLFYQKILHLRVQILAWLASLSEKFYEKSRNKFVKEVVKDKKGVPHFWSHLKKYKKEMDEEQQNKIEDESINSIKK
jgi:hypothetical protein